MTNETIAQYRERIEKMSIKEIQKEIFSLSDMFDTIFADYHTQIHMVKYVHFHIHPYLNIFADRHKIRVVLENILENQLKYKDSQIAIRAYQNQKDQIIILFYNDGASIGPELKKPNLYAICKRLQWLQWSWAFYH
mgnify:CR=1 FL=1